MTFPSIALVAIHDEIGPPFAMTYGSVCTAELGAADVAVAVAPFEAKATFRPEEVKANTSPRVKKVEVVLVRVNVILATLLTLPEVLSALQIPLQSNCEAEQVLAVRTSNS